MYIYKIIYRIITEVLRMSEEIRADFFAFHMSGGHF